MVKESLGLLEVAGLLGAITASDAMVKAANVRLVGIEKAKGSGWMTVKVAGDVAAVDAAVQTGVAITTGMNLYVAHKVIPRPAEGLVEAFNDDFKEQPAKLSVEIEPVKEVVKEEPNKDGNDDVKHGSQENGKAENEEKKSSLDEKAVKVLNEIVSTIVDPKDSKKAVTKKATPKKSTKKK
ncbi:BMC domain-containing protein [Veillonella sp.]|jgi:propanediol utilization protein pduA|uniref:BMC domain-containing protein n=1 Tax=Veillonella TaxID=29465 RepID=UPI002901477F|nr:BMC domain-containing protein [Veillonella sp.]MDU2154624.1 BMC domain-containing protein [Veillonella sp.]MDU5494543.1 BMC domain-containing protein [Veillonella sp.]